MNVRVTVASIAVDGSAPSYRVSVFAFDWVQRGRGVR